MFVWYQRGFFIYPQPCRHFLAVSAVAGRSVAVDRATASMPNVAKQPKKRRSKRRKRRGAVTEPAAVGPSQAKEVLDQDGQQVRRAGGRRQKHFKRRERRLMPAAAGPSLGKEVLDQDGQQLRRAGGRRKKHFKRREGTLALAAVAPSLGKEVEVGQQSLKQHGVAHPMLARMTLMQSRSAEAIGTSCVAGPSSAFQGSARLVAP